MPWGTPSRAPSGPLSGAEPVDDIQPHDLRATLALEGDLIPVYHYDGLTRDQGRIVMSNDWRPPQYGPGYELSAGDARHSHHEITYGMRWEGYWGEDFMTGWHAFIGEQGIEAHYGYQEPFGIDLPNDRNVSIGQEVVPWDYGLSATHHTNELIGGY